MALRSRRNPHKGEVSSQAQDLLLVDTTPLPMRLSAVAEDACNMSVTRHEEQLHLQHGIDWHMELLVIHESEF